MSFFSLPTSFYGCVTLLIIFISVAGMLLGTKAR